jgi:outer membrane protein assembly factor BamB
MSAEISPFISSHPSHRRQSAACCLPAVSACLAMLLVLFGAGGLALAQVLTFTTADTATDANQKKQPFVLPAPSADTLEAIEDFRRAVGKEAWEKAFKQIDKLIGGSATGLVPADNGFKLPLQMAIASALVQLPPAGKNAYRLFHDAEAKAAWEKLQADAASDDLPTLTRLASVELITAVGDLAANRLGDVLFEQGDMDGAIDAWQRVLNDRPDSNLPRADLLAKTATALARAGRWAELSEVQRQITTRYAGEPITVGGQRVSASEYATQLGERQSTAEADPREVHSPDLQLPANNEPVWQFRFESGLADPRRRVRRWGPWGIENNQGTGEMVMPAAVVGERLYANWLGCDFALDLQTGKLVWRSRRFHDAVQGLQQGNWLAVDRFSLAAGGNQLWTLTRGEQKSPQQPNVPMQPGGNLCLVRRDPATGKELLNSTQVEGLKAWTPVGAPVPAGNVVYLTAFKENQPTELYALAVQAKDGRVLWSTALGTYQFSPYENSLRGTRPTMLLHGTRLYVDSQAGALIELQAASGALRWAYSYESESPEGRQRYGIMPTATFNPSVPVIAGGLLFSKGMHSGRLNAVRLDGPGLAWKRTAPLTATLVGVDEHHFYLSGEEVLCYDLNSQQLLWSNRLPQGTNWVQPLITANHFYQFTPRGVYELDKVTGDVVRLFRGADLDCSGGSIVAANNLFLTISNKAVTAYRLPPAGQTP